MSQIQTMDSAEGNQLVERIAQAAARLRTEQGATIDQAAAFIDKNLTLLSLSQPEFIRACLDSTYYATVSRSNELSAS